MIKVIVSLLLLLSNCFIQLVSCLLSESIARDMTHCLAEVQALSGQGSCCQTNGYSDDVQHTVSCPTGLNWTLRMTFHMLSKRAVCLYRNHLHTGVRIC